ncbi:MAG: hypothetical protein AAB393_08135 [Bacteroidota bacterium]
MLLRALVLLLAFSSARVEAEESKSEDVVSALRSAEHHILLAERATTKGQRGGAVREYRKACISILGAMQMLSAQAYVHLQDLQSRRDTRAAARLKTLDTLSLQAERLLTRSLDGLAASLPAEDIGSELNSLHKQFPKNRTLHERLISDFARHRRWADVVAESERLLQNHRSSKTAHLLQARANEAQGSNAEAILAYQRALEVDDRDSVAYEHVRRLLTTESRFGEWVAYLERKARLDPRNAVVQKLLRESRER